MTKLENHNFVTPNEIIELGKDHQSMLKILGKNVEDIDRVQKYHTIDNLLITKRKLYL